MILQKTFEPQLAKTYLLISASNDDSNMPAHPSSLVSLCCPHEETLHPSLSKIHTVVNCANAQADLNLCLAHMSEGTFSDVTAYS